MPRLHPQHRLPLHPSLVRAHVRTADPGARRVAAVFVDEFTGEDKDLFAPDLGVALKTLARLI